MKMRKLFGKVLVAVAAIALSGVACAAIESYTAADGIKYYFEVIDGKAHLFRGNQTAAVELNGKRSVSIPRKLGNCDVEYISDYAFYSCSSVTNVVIPNTVKYIGDYAFCECRSLKNLTIPNSVKEIGEYAFNCCFALESVKLPESVVHIGSWAYSFCRGLKEVYIPSKVGRLYYDTFRGCTNLTTVTLPYGMTNIQARAFAECSNLTTIYIPASLKSSESSMLTAALPSFSSKMQIRYCWSNTLNNVTWYYQDVNKFNGSSYFFSYRELRHIEPGSPCVSPKPKGGLGIPYSIQGTMVSSIGKGAFAYCYDLESVGFGGPVTNIADEAFEYCYALTNITVPASVTGIGSHAFYSCTNLANVTMRSGLTSIGSQAFWLCQKLTQVDIPDTVTSIGDLAFGNCTKLRSAHIPYSLLGKLREPYMFFRCASNLLMVYGYGTDKAIGAQIFKDYTWYYDVNTNIGGGRRLFKTEGTVPVSPTPKGTVIIPTNINGYAVRDLGYGLRGLTEVTEVVVPSGVKSISEGAFKECTKLGRIALGGTTNIMDQAFEGCTSLTGLTWSADSKLEEIGTCAFYGCTALKRFNFPSGLKNVGQMAFEGCTGLTSITFKQKLESIDSCAFEGCTNLASVSFPTNVKEISSSAFSGCTKLKAVSFDAGSTCWLLGQKAFESCTSLKTVTLPDSLTTIGNEIFKDCTGLEEASLPGSLYKTVKSNNIFRGCSSSLRVIFRGITFKVTFDKNGGSGGSDYVYADKGQVMPAATAPTKTGYLFKGYWDTTKDGGKQYYDDAMKSVRNWDGTSDTTLWAKWEKVVVKVKVTFGKNGGSGGDDYVTATYGQPMPTPRKAPTKTGYVFDGYWDTTKDGGKQYYDGAMKSVRNWDGTSNTTLWAKWRQAAVVKVTFGKNGGTGGDDYVTATYGSAMPTPRTAPKLTGWTFAGYWDTLAMDEKGVPKGKQYYDANMKSVNAWDKTTATTLWAKWTTKVTFGKNGGTGGDNVVTCTKGQPMPTRTMPTKSGYAFAGYWTTTGTGGVKYYNADGTSAHTWDKSGSVTLWAKWEKAVSVKVTLGKNGGTGGDAYVTATTGQPMPTPRTAPTRTGWTFDGYWDTLAQDANGNPTGKQYYDKDMKSVRIWDKPSATTLWAKWTVKVTLGKNGGTGGDSSVIVTYNQPFPKKAMPTRSGYTFGGYFVSASSKTGQCYNPDGTGTSSMKWTTGGTPTIWALWTKTSSCVEVAPSAFAVPASPAPAAAEPAEIPAGLYSGVLADGKGTFCLLLDEAEEGLGRTAFLYVVSEDALLAEECSVVPSGRVLFLEVDGEPLFGVEFGDDGARLVPVN